MLPACLHAPKKSGARILHGVPAASAPAALPLTD